MIGPVPLCMNCIHLREDNQIGYRCDAFPVEIPPEIIEGVIDHTEPYPGDNGVLYEPKDKAEDKAQ